MASHHKQSQHIPLSPLLNLQPGGVESFLSHPEPMPSDALHKASEDEYRSISLSRRPSAASSVSVASSQARNQVGRPPKQVLKDLNDHVRKIASTATGRYKQSRFPGWRTGVLCGSCMSAIILCCNIAIVILSSVKDKGNQNGEVDVISGGAPYIARWSTIFHLLINASSTILLSASNYTMQVLCSPTRSELDAVHAKGKCLDIVLLSFRNLMAIPRSRAALCLLLALSSLPLHLFYNAAVFQIITSNKYRILAINIASEKFKELNSSSDYFKSLGNTQWREPYDVTQVSEYDDLYLIIDRIAFSASEQHLVRNMPEYWPLEIADGNQTAIRNITSESPDWIRYDQLGNLSRPNLLSSNDDHIYFNGAWPISAHVAHAFGKIVRQQSRLQTSLHSMIIVSVFNAIKLAVMIWVLITDERDYIVTLGDAAASFLKRPESMTIYQCTLGREEILYNLGHFPYHTRIDEQLMHEDYSRRISGKWLPQTTVYLTFIGKDRQVFFALLICCIVPVSVLFPFLARFDFGAWGTSSDNSLSFGDSVLFNAWMVNLPQVILSLCYLLLNGICTSMASAEEWNNMARTRKGLRVTRPQGKQRSTHFLQLPYKWAVPLIITSGVLHWLLSQSLFLVRIDVFDQSGFSLLSLMTFLIVFTILLSVIGWVGFRGLNQRLPFAASCSLVISAACQTAEDEINPHLGEVKWGAVAGQVEQGYEHCSITSKHTKKRGLVEGRMYR